MILLVINSVYLRDKEERERGEDKCSELWEDTSEVHSSYFEAPGGLR